MALSDPAQFLVTVEMNHGDRQGLGLKEVLRLRTREADALYTAVKVAVNTHYEDPMSPGEAGDWFAEHILGYYPELMDGRMTHIRIEENAEHEGSDGTIVFVTVYRLWG